MEQKQLKVSVIYIYIAAQKRNQRNTKTTEQIENDAHNIYAHNCIIDKHKYIVENGCHLRSKMTYQYLGKDYYNSIREAVKGFVEGQGVIVESLHNDFIKYNIQCELIDDID